MRQISLGTRVAAALALLAGAAGAAGPPSAPVSRCAVDAVVSGAGCMDKYEASLWQVPEPLGANRILVKKIQQPMTLFIAELGRRSDYFPRMSWRRLCARWSPGQADALRHLIATDVRSETSRVA